MARKVADCRKYPSDVQCTLTFCGEEEEVLKAACDHAVKVHGHPDSPALKEQIRAGLEDEDKVYGSMPAGRTAGKPDLSKSTLHH